MSLSCSVCADTTSPSKEYATCQVCGKPICPACRKLYQDLCQSCYFTRKTPKDFLNQYQTSHR